MGLFLRHYSVSLYFWRRRVDTFEVLGLDQARRLTRSAFEGPHPAEAQSFSCGIRSRPYALAVAG